MNQFTFHSEEVDFIERKCIVDSHSVMEGHDNRAGKFDEPGEPGPITSGSKDLGDFGNSRLDSTDHLVSG